MYPGHLYITFVMMTSLITGKPYSEFEGTASISCAFLWIVGSWSQITSATNSFCLAVYRFVIMRYPIVARNKIGDYNLMYIFAVLMLALPSIILYVWMQGAELTKFSMIRNFCTGRNSFMSNIVADYSGRTQADLDQGTEIVFGCSVNVNDIHFLQVKK